MAVALYGSGQFQFNAHWTPQGAGGSDKLHRRGTLQAHRLRDGTAREPFTTFELPIDLLPTLAHRPQDVSLTQTEAFSTPPSRPRLLESPGPSDVSESTFSQSLVRISEVDEPRDTSLVPYRLISMTSPEQPTGPHKPASGPSDSTAESSFSEAQAKFLGAMGNNPGNYYEGVKAAGHAKTFQGHLHGENSSAQPRSHYFGRTDVTDYTITVMGDVTEQTLHQLFRQPQDDQASDSRQAPQMYPFGKTARVRSEESLIRPPRPLLKQEPDNESHLWPDEPFNKELNASPKGSFSARRRAFVGFSQHLLSSNRKTSKIASGN